MNISPSDILLLSHAAFGATASLAAVWVFVETLNAQPGNSSRIRKAALSTALAMAAALIVGGYWYLRFYPADKKLILQGPWPFAHNIFMESKEHLVFVTGILALLLPLVTRENLATNSAARKLTLSVAALIAVTGLAVEGAGAVIDHGVKVALLRGDRQGESK